MQELREIGKMQWNRLFRAQSATCVHTRGWRRAGLLVAAIVAGGLFCSVPVRSLADLPAGDHVYVQNSGGSYTDVTSQVFFVGDQAYLYPNNPMPITLDYQE